MSSRREHSSWSAIVGELPHASLADPFAAAHERVAAERGEPSRARALFQHWNTRAAGSPRGDMRYRWELTHRRGVPLPRFSASAKGWTAWRPAEQALLERDPFELEERLSLPIALAENTDLLARESFSGDELAAELLREALPVIRRDYAGFVQALDPWRDTFALWCLTRRERALGLLHPLALAIATCYAAGAEAGVVRGLRFPFHEQPLASASAQLASSLLTLGMELDLAAALVAFVRDQQRESGSWGDADEPSDLLTTWVAAELLERVDPSFDFSRTAAELERMRGGSALWRALGPEALWLSAEVARSLDEASASFPRRFRWPFVQSANLDRKTGLPFFAYFADVARLFEKLEGLAAADVELGFIDLVGFRVFNNTYGQERGDDVLAAFARALETLPSSRAIRDGGDEFIVLSAPTRRGLAGDLDAFRQSWPRVFQTHFGADVPPVAPRIVVGTTPGRRLVAARETLGRRIGDLKGVEIGEEGLLVELGAIG